MVTGTAVMSAKPPSGAVTTSVSPFGPGTTSEEATSWAGKAPKSTAPGLPSSPMRSSPSMVTCVPAGPSAGDGSVMTALLGAVGQAGIVM